MLVSFPVTKRHSKASSRCPVMPQTIKPNQKDCILITSKYKRFHYYYHYYYY
jgi:hypothetical protein